VKATFQVVKWKERHDGHSSTHFRTGIRISRQNRQFLVFSSNGELRVQEILNKEKFQFCKEDPRPINNAFPDDFLIAVVCVADSKLTLQQFLETFGEIRGPRG